MSSRSRLRGPLLAAPLLLAATAWACAALAIDGPASRPLAAGLVAAFLAVVAWWLSLAPSNDRDWEPSVARLPTATFDGDLVTITNVRNFTYRSEDDYDEHWETRTYDLSQLRGVDMFLSYWGSPWIAHTIVSWQFDDGRPLAISIETRKERGEGYSAVLGFFRQFELYYVVADERDLIGLRTNYRGEDVYLYRLTTPVPLARAILVDYLRELNALAATPKWYNAATHNCTTTIRHHVQQVAPANPFDWRILVNGRIDELGYSRGTIDTSLPFTELRSRSAISSRALAAGVGPGFSEVVRRGLPDPRAPSGG